MHIERATPQDAEAILHLQYAAYQSEAALYDDPFIPPLTQTLDQLSAEFEDHIVLKATIGGSLVHHSGSSPRVEDDRRPTTDDRRAGVGRSSVVCRRSSQPSRDFRTAQLVGSVRAHLDGTTGHIGRLMVDPAYQGQGIGRRLMEAIEAALAPATRYELFTGDRSERNLALYQHLGYRQVRTERLSPRVTLVFLEKVAPACR